jgi:hypothetical protein
MGIKYKVNESFFDEWSSGMAYVLGYLYADGSLEDASYLRGKYVRVTSVEKNIIVKIRKWLSSKHTIVKQKSLWKNGKLRYMLRIGSHKIYDSLVNLGLYPNKSLTIKFPEIPNNFLGDFIRGYLDGDGCVYLYRIKGKNGKLIIKKLSVIFTSGSKIFLEKLNLVLKRKIGVRQIKIYKGQRCFQLRYGTSDSIKVFKLLYGKAQKDFYFKRKLNVFLKYFRLRPVKVDKDIQSILVYLNH